MQKRKLYRILGLLTYVAIAPLAQAAAPVVDAAEEVPLIQGSGNDVSSSRSLPLPQRVDKVERQLANQAETLNQISALQQQVQDLRGQLEVQAHDLAQLKEQQSSMYKDLDKRVNTKDTPKKPLAADDTTDDSTESATETANKHKDADDSVKDDKASDQESYQAATKRITNKDYDGGLKAMKAYVKNYPEGKHVANAYYWMGELYLLKNNAAVAIKAFTTIVTKYPDHSKAADAMLKLGNIYADENQTAKARQMLNKVKTNFSGTAAARLAAERLKTLKSKEHKDLD